MGEIKQALMVYNQSGMDMKFGLARFGKNTD
jgi:hypothetical protein